MNKPEYIIKQCWECKEEKLHSLDMLICDDHFPSYAEREEQKRQIASALLGVDYHPVEVNKDDL